MDRLTPTAALQALQGHADPYRELFTHGTLSVEIYRPEQIDRQQPHDRDEVYVVLRGKGVLTADGRDFAAQEGRVLFVKAGVEHHFHGVEEDLALLVFFAGAS